MDIGPYVALIALIAGTPYMVRKRQWVLAGCFMLIAVAVVARTFLGAIDLASTLTWASLVLLAVGVDQLRQQRRAAQSIDG